MKATQVEIPPAIARQLNDAVRAGYALLTKGGKPIMYLLPTSIYDEEDIGYMTDPAFWKMIAERRSEQEPAIPLGQIKAELEEELRTEGKRSPQKAKSSRRKAS